MALALGTLALAPASARAQDTGAAMQQYDIGAGDLGTALNQFADQSGLHVLFDAALVKGRRAPAVQGRLGTRETLARLLQGSGLQPDFVNDKTVILKRAPVPAPAPTQDDTGASTQAPPASVEEPVEIERLVVTGTHIRGVQPSSPVVAVTQEEMRLAGHHNLGEVIRGLPQNYTGGQNPGVVLGAQTGDTANYNFTGGSALNLRGLGADATLTLLNGVRMPYDSSNQSIDISVIPVAAVERLEVLLDGASAIYGSDAVGGVANIVLKRDYEGFELSARRGAATEGGYGQQQYTALGGTTWESGGFLVAADYSSNTAVNAGDRDFLDNAVGSDATVFPETHQRSVLLSAHQQLGQNAELSVDAFYTSRDQRNLMVFPGLKFPDTKDATIWGLAPTLDFDLPGQWTARLGGVIGQDEVEVDQRTIVTPGDIEAARSLRCLCNRINAVDLQFEGPLFSLPAGDVRVSFGGGYRKSEFVNRVMLGVGNTSGGEDSSRHVYAETVVPLTAKLTLNGALRHERYDSFGSTTTPKIGAIWRVVPALDLKASWGKSFKVPTLSQQFANRAVVHYPGAFVAGVPAGATLIATFGGNPDLGPERAEVVTAGFVAKPRALPGFTLELSWFDIDYTDRVFQPVNPLGEALTNPAFADFITVDPTLEQQNAVFAAFGLAPGAFTNDFVLPAPYDPDNVALIIHNLLTNVSSQHVRGVDLMVRYEMDAFGGDLLLSGNANWLDSQRKLTRLAPLLPVSGRVFFPAEFKAKLSAAWLRGGLSLAATASYTDGVTDTNVTPHVGRNSMTTLDLVVGYQLRTAATGEWGFGLAIANALNERPPFMQPIASQPYLAPYDSTNYSALGRLVSVTVTKRF